jgi:hypothetical protein
MHQMKNKAFFSIIIITAIFVPLFFVAAYTETGPDIIGGATTPAAGGTTTLQGGATIIEGGGTAPKGGASTPKGGADTPQGGAGTPEGGGTTPEGGADTPQGGSNFLSFGGLSLSQFFYNLQLYIWIIFATLAILMFVFAGFLFLVAQGQPEKLKTAKSAFIWGIVGAVIAILAYTIRAVIGGIFNF